MEEAGGSSPFLFTHSCSPLRPIWIHWRTTGLFARALSQAVFTAVLHGQPVCGLKLWMKKRDKCIPCNLFSPHLPELRELPDISCHKPSDLDEAGQHKTGCAVLPVLLAGLYTRCIRREGLQARLCLQKQPAPMVFGALKKKIKKRSEAERKPSAYTSSLSLWLERYGKGYRSFWHLPFLRNLPRKKGSAKFTSLKCKNKIKVSAKLLICADEEGLAARNSPEVMPWRNSALTHPGAKQRYHLLAHPRGYRWA